MGDPVTGRFTGLVPASRGGAGSVFRAVDTQTGALVALKVMHGAATVDADRLAREAEALAAVDHPGIVRYVAHGATRDGELYLAMEWLEGETLAERLKRGPLAIVDAIALAGRLATALAAAHAAGVIHRDLKPHNVILVGGALDQPKLVDLGLAKLIGARALTLTGSIMGTPAYMAPEQARGTREVDARADVFALGCVLYECLCGQPPFRGDDPWAVLAKVLFEDPVPAGELRAEVPPALDALVLRLLAKAPGDRPDADALATRLAGLGADPGAREAARRPLGGPEKRLVALVVADVAPGGRPSLATDATMAATPIPGAPPPFAETLTKMRAIAQPFGAYVEQLAAGHLVGVLSGDGVAADLAGQAARCALALRARLEHAPIVLATGAALVIGRMPVGEIIDRAARLLAAGSEPDADGRLPVVIDEVTAGLLAPTFVAGQRGARLELWGERRGAPPVRTLLGRPAPFVGRDRELLTVEASLAEVVAESVARAVLVTGPPGAGKSRLRHEVLVRAAQRGLPAAWIGRGSPVGAGSPFGLIADALRGALEIADGWPLEALRRRVRERADGPGCAFLGELVGVPFPDDDDVPLHAARRDPQLMGDRIRAAFEDFVRARTDDGPVMIVLEDLHWGDLPSVRLIEAALRDLAARPLFVLALGRPEVAERFGPLWQEQGCVHLPLPELSRRAGERLVRSVLPAVADDALARILDRAAGNAFLLEELTRATAEGWTELPETVRAVAQARLDGLEPEARRVLRAASVFGNTFWAGGVVHVLGEGASERVVRARLDQLVDDELVTRRETSRLAGERELGFRHVLIREAAYESLDAGDRRLAHGLAGEWLEARGERDAMLLAGHFDRAGQAERAAHGYLQAAADALAGNDFDAVVDRVARGAALTSEPAVQARLHLALAEAHRWRGDHAAGEAAGRAAMAAAAPDGQAWIEAAARRGELAMFRQSFELADEMARALIDARPDPAALGSWITGCAKLATRMILDERPLGERLLGAVGSIDPALLSPINRAWTLRAESFDRAERGDPHAAAAAMAASAEAFERSGDARNVALQRLNQVEFLSDLGADDDAAALLAEIAPRAEQISAALAAQAAGLHALLAARGDHPEDARAIPTAAFDRGGYARLPGLALCDLAEAHRRLGDLDAAERLIAAGAERLRPFPSIRPAVAAVAAAIFVDRDRAGLALAEAAAALALPCPWAITARRASLQVAEIRALDALGRRDDARLATARAIAELDARVARIADAAAQARYRERAPGHRELLRAATA